MCSGVRFSVAGWGRTKGIASAAWLTGLDQHQVGRWASWQRWTILAMLAYAFLAVLGLPSTAARPCPTA